MRALTQVDTTAKITNIVAGRNEVTAREGIDTPLSS